ncbi:MAG: DUF3987 domain-containing protein [Verrucomicrobiota bacterium]
MAREAARVSTCRNEPLAAAAVLGVTSAAIGASLAVDSGPSRKTRGNLFLLAVAESGTGKTETFKHAAEPLDSLEAEAMSQWRVTVEPGLRAALSVCVARSKKLTDLAAKIANASDRQAHAQELSVVEAERIDLSTRLSCGPHLRVSDITKEKLAELMHGQPGEAMGSMSSEARGIISILEGRYSSGGDGDLYCAGYSGDSVQMDRVKNLGRIVLRNPCLSILWMMQGDIVQKAFASETMSESGFLPRFLTFDSRAQPQEHAGDLPPISEATKEAWRCRVAELVAMRSSGDTATIPVSSGAKERFLAYENENVRRRRSDGDLAGHAPFVGRWSENAWRLGVVLHAAQHSSESAQVELSPETAASAIRLMRWFANGQLEFLHQSKRQQCRERMDHLKAVLTNKDGKTTMNILEKNHGFKATEVRHMATLFPGHVSIVVSQPTGGGRPSTVVSLTPNPQNPE